MLGQFTAVIVRPLVEITNLKRWQTWWVTTRHSVHLTGIWLCVAFHGIHLRRLCVARATHSYHHPGLKKVLVLIFRAGITSWLFFIEFACSTILRPVRLTVFEVTYEGADRLKWFIIGIWIGLVHEVIPGDSFWKLDWLSHFSLRLTTYFTHYLWNLISLNRHHLLRTVQIPWNCHRQASTSSADQCTSWSASTLSICMAHTSGIL